MTKVKKGIIEYLDQRIKTMKNLLRIAQERGNEKMEFAYEYGLGILEGVKRDITEDSYIMRFYENHPKIS